MEQVTTEPFEHDGKTYELRTTIGNDGITMQILHNEIPVEGLNTYTSTHEVASDMAMSGRGNAVAH